MGAEPRFWKRPLLVLVAALCAVALIAGGVGTCVYIRCNTFADIKEEKILRRNLSWADAQKELRFPLPAGAKNISFAMWGLWQGYEFYLRFEAPPEMCIEHIPVVLAKWRKENPSLSPGYEATVPVQITAPPSPCKSNELDISWFDIGNIKKGLADGEGGSHRPRIWVDTDRGVFYYCITD
jgi:hypothetical protein